MKHEITQFCFTLKQNWVKILTIPPSFPKMIKYIPLENLQMSLDQRQAIDRSNDIFNVSQT